MNANYTYKILSDVSPYYVWVCVHFSPDFLTFEKTISPYAIRTYNRTERMRLNPFAVRR